MTWTDTRPSLAAEGNEALESCPFCGEPRQVVDRYRVGDELWLVFSCKHRHPPDYEVRAQDLAN